MRLTDCLAASIAVVVVLGGCARAVSTPPAPAAPSDSTARRLAAIGDSLAPRLFHEWSDAVAATAGLPPLRSAPLEEGEREVRVWLAKFWKLPRLYRLTERAGRTTGETLTWWPSPAPDSARPSERSGQTRDDLMGFRLAGSCGDFARRPPIGLCRVQFRTAPDWTGLLASADGAGVWKLLDGPERWSFLEGLDGWHVTVELRHGRRYTVRDYWSPASAQSADQARVIALLQALESLDSLMQPRAALRVYRGVTRGRPEDAFRPCDGDVEWEFRGMLPSPPGKSAADTGLPGDTLASERYVEVVGVLSPEWDARRRGSRFPRILDVEHVATIAPWTGRECR